MRTIIVFILFVALFVASLAREPIDHTMDAIAGSTNQTYQVTVDSIAAATEDEDEDEEDEDEEDDD